ncbi:MAG: hypothetical protein Q8O00_13920, partial [Holophaga sp.]|nr:hypothetical protein [Holophaga sp.]
MRQFLPNLSLKRRIILLLVLISGLTVLTSAAAFLAFEYSQIRESLVNSLKTYADIASRSIGPELDFPTQTNSASSTLSSLESNRHIR